jgi:folate-binding protein YgfZ
MTGYEAAHSAIAKFDRSAVGKVTIIGPDAVPFLHRLCTNDLTSLAVGDGCSAFLCDPRAKVLHQIWVNRSADGLWLETVPGRGEALFQTLDRYFISERLELLDVTERYRQWHVCGPTAASHFPDLKPLQMTWLADRMICRHDRLGVPGFDVIAETMIGLPGELGDAEAYETLRIEACSPEFGKDIDESRFVMEVAGATDAVSYAKGCFPGQEPIVMARDRAGFINRAFLPMIVREGGPIAPGSKLTRDGAEVGVVTSSCHSPRLGQSIAIGYIKRGHQEPGTVLSAEGREVEVLSRVDMS